MNLKELIKKVEKLERDEFEDGLEFRAIKQTVEAVDEDIWVYCKRMGFEFEDWQKLKRLLRVRKHKEK